MAVKFQEVKESDKLVEIKEDVCGILTSENSYEISIMNFDILTEKMNDNFLPYRIEQNVMMWLSDDGLLGEIECIYPELLVEEVNLVKDQNMVKKSGFPLINMDESLKVPKVKIFLGKEYFILYFSESQNYNKIIISESLTFYVSNATLIAIKANVS